MGNVSHRAFAVLERALADRKRVQIRDRRGKAMFAPTEVYNGRITGLLWVDDGWIVESSTDCGKHSFPIEHLSELVFQNGILLVCVGYGGYGK